jgi:hypothetical protein
VAWVNRVDHDDHHLECRGCCVVENSSTLVTPQRAIMFSTGCVENFVEIIGLSFTKLLQTRTYNTLHTLAA